MAQRQDLTIDQGSRFRWNYFVTGLSLVGLTPTMQVRKARRDETVLLDATAYVTIDQMNNIILVDIPGAATEDMIWVNGVYDLKVFDPLSELVSPVRIAQGDVILDGEVTQ